MSDTQLSHTGIIQQAEPGLIQPELSWSWISHAWTLMLSTDFNLPTSSVGTWLFLMLLVHSGIQLFRLHFFVVVIYMHILFCICISMCFSTSQEKTTCTNENYRRECKMTRAYLHQLVLEIKSERMEERVLPFVASLQTPLLPIYRCGILLLISKELQMPKTCKHTIWARLLLMQLIFLTLWTTMVLLLPRTTSRSKNNDI